jgi:hypothetical protein
MVTMQATSQLRPKMSRKLTESECYDFGLTFRASSTVSTDNKDRSRWKAFTMKICQKIKDRRVCKTAKHPLEHRIHDGCPRSALPYTMSSKSTLSSTIDLSAPPSTPSPIVKQSFYHQPKRAPYAHRYTQLKIPTLQNASVSIVPIDHVSHITLVLDLNELLVKPILEDQIYYVREPSNEDNHIFRNPSTGHAVEQECVIKRMERYYLTQGVEPALKALANILNLNKRIDVTIDAKEDKLTFEEMLKRGQRIDDKLTSRPENNNVTKHELQHLSLVLCGTIHNLLDLSPIRFFRKVNTSVFEFFPDLQSMTTELSGGQKLKWKIDREEEASLAAWLDEMEKLDVGSNETVDGDDEIIMTIVRLGTCGRWMRAWRRKSIMKRHCCAYVLRRMKCLRMGRLLSSWLR